MTPDNGISETHKKASNVNVMVPNPVKGKGTAMERTENFLKERAPQSYNYKTLAQELNLNENTVRSCLSRLYNRGRIKQEHKGFYRARIDADIIPAWLHGDIKLHGLKIEARIPENYSAIGGHSLVAQHRTSSDEHRDTYSVEFDARAITITVHRDGLVEIFNKCSQKPLGFLDFAKFVAYLEGVFPFFAIMDPRLVQLGLNVDSKVLRLEGVKALKLQTFANAWISMYQKSGRGLRTEVHLNPKELTLTEALTILRTISEFPQKGGESQ